MNTNWIEMTCEVEVREGESFALPESVSRGLGPGRWIVHIRSAERASEGSALRDHSAFLKGYAAQDEGLYDDAAAG